jgi:hypothetical protein
MVERVITSRRNVVDFASYQQSRNAAGTTLAVSARTCRHCGAALAEGESEAECSSAFNTDAVSFCGTPRKFFAD